MTLFINACVRKESRTMIVAKEIMKKNNFDEYVEINLEKEPLFPLNQKRLEYRENLIKAKIFDDKCFDYAKQFANAENIVIAAPYWDLGLPAILKIYLENICVPNIAFRYSAKGPVGLCKAKKLIYITTAGGKVFVDFGYSYIKSLAQSLFGIKDVMCYRAENLDVNNISSKEVLQKVDIIEIN